MKNLLLLIAIAISLNSFGQIPPNIPSNGLIGWWPFNGNADDESGNINNGTINGAVLTSDRTNISNSAYHFNGTSDFISLANVPQTSLDSITISCWMRATSLNQFGMALCYGLDSGSAPSDGIQFGLTGNISPCSGLTGNEVSFIHGGVACASTGYLFLDTLTWHHVILEHKNSITKIFVDANLVHTQTLTANSPVTQFTIGSASNIRFFEGDIDDVGVWSRTLTSCEIQNMYDNSNVGVDTQTACDSYTWINSVTYTNSNNTAIHTIVNGATNGCDSIVELDLTINALPTVTASGTATICDGQSTSLTAGGASTYTWDNSAGTGSPVSVSPSTTTTYTVTGTNGNTCANTAQVTVTVNPLPDVTVATATNLLTANNVNAGVAYQWLDCNNNYAIIASETAQSYAVTATGDYAVEVTENSCVDTSVCNNVIFVGIEENSFGNSLIVYPNPTDGNFSIDFGSNYKAVTIIITDVTDKIIQSKTYNDSQLLSLNIEEPSGVYLLVIESGDKKAVIRLVKE